MGWGVVEETEQQNMLITQTVMLSFLNLRRFENVHNKKFNTHQ